MEKQVVDFDIAKKLKKLKFNEKCFGYYSNYEGNSFRNSESVLYKGSYYCGIELCYLAPLWQQAERWLWEKHKISIQVEEKKKRKFALWIMTENDAIQNDERFDSPITAKMEGIRIAVQYLSKNK